MVLHNLLSVLEKNKQVTFSWIADVCVLTLSKQGLLEYASVCLYTHSLTQCAIVDALLCNEHLSTQVQQGR